MSAQVIVMANNVWFGDLRKTKGERVVCEVQRCITGRGGHSPLVVFFTNKVTVLVSEEINIG